jgi:hypothetical protein
MNGVEEALGKDRGQEHVNSLRKLAMAWQNAEVGRIDAFLEVFNDRSVDGEEALRDRLRMQGFTV